MRLKPDQLAGALGRALAPVYLVTGDEPLQRMECVDAVRARAGEAGYAERIVMEVERGFDWGVLAAEAQSMSLFAERRLIELRLSTDRPDAEAGRTLKAYAEAPVPDVLLLIQGPRLKPEARRAAWAKAVEAAGVWVEVWPLEEAAFASWLETRLRSRGLQPAREVVALLVARTQGNLPAAAQDVDKLALLNPPGRLELAAALESVADNARYGLFDLADAMLGGDARAVVRMMDGLREEGAATPLVVWMLAEEVRRLLALAEAQAGGEPLEPRIARIYPQPRQALYRRALGRLRLNALRGLLVACARADRIVKSRPLRSQWAELLDLALCVAGETSPGQRARRTAAALAEPIPE